MGQKASRLQRDAASDAPVTAPSTKGRPNTATGAGKRDADADATANARMKPRRRSIQLPARFRPSSSKGRAAVSAGPGAGPGTDKENAGVGVLAKKAKETNGAPASKPKPTSVLVPSAPPRAVTEDGAAPVKRDVLPVLHPEPTSPPGLLITHKAEPAPEAERAAAVADSVPPPIALGPAPDAQAKVTPRLRIAIVGGGIGGLSLAAFLKLSSAASSDLEINIYEAAPSLTELGAGVGMWLRTWRIMRAFSERKRKGSEVDGEGEGSSGNEGEGEAPKDDEELETDGEEDTLVADLAKIAPAGRDMRDTVTLRKAFEFRMGESPSGSGAGPEGETKNKRGGEGRSFYTMEVPFGVLTLHRADFQQVIARHAIPPAVPHFGKRLVDYVEDPASDSNSGAGAITLHFTDGTRARCDLLVGADGIRSATRGAMYRRLVQSGEFRLPGMDDLLPPPSPPTEPNSSSTPAELALKAVPLGDGARQVADGHREKGDTKTSDSGAKVAGVSDPPSLPTPTSPRLDPVSDFVDPVWSGTLVYRALIPKAALDAAWPGHRAGVGPVCYFGKSKHVLAFPIMHTAPAASAGPAEPASSAKLGARSANTTGEPAPGGGAPSPTPTPTPMVNLVAFTSQPEREGTRIDGAWVRPAPATNLLAEFAGWEGEVRALLALVADPLLWAIHTVRPLPRYSDGRRVVLLGDAAHAMTPHQGAGGGQAIEDAYVLAALLAHPRTNVQTLGHALAAYERVRVPVSQAVARKSRLNGMLYELNAGPGVVVGAAGRSSGEVGGEEEAEAERLRALADAIMEIHRWEWEESAEGQVGEAGRHFEELLASSPAGGGASMEPPLTKLTKKEETRMFA